MGKGVNFKPDGYHTITPSISVKDPIAAMAFFKKAFGAEEIMMMKQPDGSVMHAEFKIGDSLIMMGGECPHMGMVAPTPGKTSSGLHIYVSDVDAAFKRAVDAGGAPIMPPMDMFWGDRYAKITDPFGHVWGLATHVEDVSPEECGKRAANFKPPGQ